MLDRHEDLGVTPAPGADRIADDTGTALIAELIAEPMIDPCGGMSLLGGSQAIGLEDLGDDLEEGAKLGFDAGTNLLVTRRLVAGKDLLESGPMEVKFPAGRAFREPFDQYAPPDLSPVVHAVVHR
jgi:hypothetical protein